MTPQSVMSIKLKSQIKVEGEDTYEILQISALDLLSLTDINIRRHIRLIDFSRGGEKMTMMTMLIK